MSMNDPYGMGPGGYRSGGRPATSAVRDPAGLNQAPNPLISDEYEQALLRAMKMAGLNPSSLNPNVSKVMQKGKQLVQELILQTEKSGNREALASAPDMLNMLAGLIRSAITGGKVFGGADKASALESIMNLVNQGAQGSTGSVGGDFLAQLMASPSSALNLFSEAKYGNLADAFQRTATHSLIGLLNDFYQQQQDNPSGMPNFLATLLGGQSGTASNLGTPSMLPSGIGGGVAGGGSGGPQAAVAPPVSPSPLGQGTPPALGALSPYQQPLMGAPPNMLPPGQDPTAILRQLGMGSYLGGGAGY